jgi:hypothetical protein
MNSNLTPGHDPAPRTPPSAARQIDWQFLDAVGARAALAGLPSEAPVLLVTFQENHVGAITGAAGWEGALAQSLLEQVQVNSAPRVLMGPAGLELHAAARLAFCGGHELSLTSTEFSLLEELLNRDGAVVAVDELSRAIWGHETLGAPNYVEAHISRLRRKLREVGVGRVIETVRGAGYRIRRQQPALTPMVPVAQRPTSFDDGMNYRRAA